MSYFLILDFNLQDETLEITDLLSFIIMAILKHTSVVETEMLFQNETVAREIITSLELLFARDTLRKVTL